ncbi:MAG: Rieske 2Fe-2S domain-containing protein [Opitutaceae bacterium]|nr:Rieske 2Fe-2S domain-containing protein [Opitutaceae bacterium]MBP9912793.1 Rieske 2Fe-2S domain-containing protein [Opitutaceae bacterium]
MPQRHPLTTVEAFPPGSKKAFTVAGRRVALCNVEGTFHAIDDVCPHAGASMVAGPLRGTTLTCPLHGISFDVANGAAVCPKNMDPVESFPVFVNGNQVEVEV